MYYTKLFLNLDLCRCMQSIIPTFNVTALVDLIVSKCSADENVKCLISQCSRIGPLLCQKTIVSMQQQSRGQGN